MTTAASSFQVVQSTDAEFRTWVAGVIALMTSCGLTQTSDTGQINTVTVTRPGTTNTSAGYVIFRFSDSLQSTAPLFLKLEFGTGSTTALPSMWLTTGKGSDGAGNLTNLLKARLQRIGSTGTVALEQRACYNEDVGVFWLCIFTLASAPIVAILGRTADEDGTPNAVGCYSDFQTSARDMESVDFSTSTSRDISLFWQAVVNIAAGDNVVDEDGYPICFSALVWCFSQIHYTAGFLGAYVGSFAPATVVRAKPYIDGPEYDFIALTGSNYPGGWDSSSDGDFKALWIWE